MGPHHLWPFGLASSPFSFKDPTEGMTENIFLSIQETEPGKISFETNTPREDLWSFSPPNLADAENCCMTTLARQHTQRLHYFEWSAPCAPVTALGSSRGASH